MSDSRSMHQHLLDWPALGFVADNHRRAAVTVSEQVSAERRTRLYATADSFENVEIIEVDEE